MTQPSIRSEVQAGTRRGKTRSACDRCHQQKLRCTKATERAACERCAKFTMECRYSPRERRTVRSKQSRTPLDPRDLAPAIVPAAPAARHNAEGLGERLIQNAGALGYLNPGPISPMPTDQGRDVVAIVTNRPGQLDEPSSTDALGYGEELAAQHISTDHENVTGEMADDYLLGLLDFQEPDNGYYCALSCGLEHPISSAAQRLTSLSMALCECASKLPSIKASRAGSSDTVDVSRAMNNSSTTRGAALLALDEVFYVTNEFVNIMNTTYPMLDHRERPALEIASSTIQPFWRLDEATTLLFLSCHCRLTEIYESIFQAIQRCIKGAHTTPHSTAGIILPQLQVGGFGGISSPALRVDFRGAPLPPAIVSMYMVLITTLSSQLWAQIKDNMRTKGGPNYSRNRAAMVHPEIADPAWDLAMKRTDNLSRVIEDIKHSL
ncbi:hypothetical protein F5Y09DRAFT_141142 [Xylaria sp. FL1042]|nr:hypothetical protein F5Y09DRAFT_141142 [Xylaria sp. FL1042]